MKNTSANRCFKRSADVFFCKKQVPEASNFVITTKFTSARGAFWAAARVKCLWERHIKFYFEFNLSRYCTHLMDSSGLGCGIMLYIILFEYISK